MHIEHVAIWTHDLERLKAFYERFFGAVAGPKYLNPARQFESYFLSFASGARLEIMCRASLHGRTPETAADETGYAHLAISVGSRARVDEITVALGAAGYPVESAPRETGDGYYESLVLDPDGHRIEITV
jgi:lactoylglutathione lyase